MELAPVIKPMTENETSKVFSQSDINGIYPPKAIPKPKDDKNIGLKFIKLDALAELISRCDNMAVSIFKIELD